MENPTKVSDALKAAASLLRDVGGKSVNAHFAADALTEIADLPSVADLEAPVDLIKQIASPSDHKLSGVTFVASPEWLNRRDLFTLAPDSDEFEGWRVPGQDDGPLMEALERQLQSYAENSGDSDDKQLGEAIGNKLKTIELDKIDVLLSEPPFLPSVTLIHVLLEDEALKLPRSEGLFFGERNEHGEWEIESFDYTSNKLHFLNHKYGVRVSGHELPYMRYFLHVVRADAGAFRVIDSKLKADIEHFAGASDGGEAMVAKAFAAWRPLTCVGVGFGGGLEYEACLLYGGAIFWAKFEVFSDGMVEMLDDEPITTIINILREA